jgi:hypothetical protein
MQSFLEDFIERLPGELVFLVGAYSVLVLVRKAGLRPAKLIELVCGFLLALAFFVALPWQILNSLALRNPIVDDIFMWVLTNIWTLVLVACVAWLAFARWPSKERPSELERSA